MAILASIGLVLTACGPVGPQPKTYVLGDAPMEDDAAEPLLGRPVLEIDRVQVPDYLDVTDILVRGQGNLVEASRTGRWGERLSVGMTRALASGLSRRLPEVVVTARAPPEAATCELMVDVQAFEAEPNRRVTLAADWRVLAPAARRTLAGERVALTEPIAAAGDEQVVTAMDGTIDKLAEGIATAVRRLGPPCTGPAREKNRTRHS